MANLATAGWGDDFERLAAQMRSLMADAAKVQLDLGRQIAPAVKLQLEFTRSFDALSRQVVLPSERFPELFASMAEAARVTKAAVPPDFYDSVKVPAADIEQLFGKLRSIAATHVELRIRLPRSGMTFLDEGFEGLDVVAEEDPSTWTVATLRRTLAATSRYYRTLVIMLGLLLTGMVMTSRQVGVDQEVAAILNQLRDAAGLLSSGVALMLALEAAKDDE